MSWISAAWQRNREAISSVASRVTAAIPIVGGAVSKAIDMGAASRELKRQQDAQNAAGIAAAQAEYDLRRTSVANAVRDTGAALTYGISERVGPTGYNPILGTSGNTTYVLYAVAALIVLYLLTRR